MKPRSIKRFFLLIFLFLTGSSFTAAQQTGGKLFGKVTDVEGKAASRSNH